MDDEESHIFILPSFFFILEEDKNLDMFFFTQLEIRWSSAITEVLYEIAKLHTKSTLD